MASVRDASSHAAAGISVTAIVEAALTVIAEHGVAGLTMRALAERLGVRAPSLYHHVRNKDELLQLVARDGFGDFAADRDAYDQVQTVQAWISLTTSGSQRLRRFYAQHPGLAALIQATATGDRADADGTRAALIRAQIDALIRIGLTRGAAREVFHTCARWTMAAVAAETVVDWPDAASNDAIFSRGLDWLMRGLQADILQLLPDQVS